jgi:hypothetical protein
MLMLDIKHHNKNYLYIIRMRKIIVNHHILIKPHISQYNHTHKFLVSNIYELELSIINHVNGINLN